MTDSLFGDLDIQNAEDNPWDVKEGAHIAFLTDLRKAPTRAGDKTGITFEYTIAGGVSDGSKVTEWKQVPEKADTPEEKRMLSFIKQRLRDLGVPETRMNRIVPGDLIGTEVRITVRKNGQYTNITKLELMTSSSNAGESGTAGSNPWGN